MSKLITIEIAKTQDVSQVVINYIMSQTQNDQPPFELPQQTFVKKFKQHNFKKTSANGWRTLINLQQKKISKDSLTEKGRKTQPSFVSCQKIKTQNNRYCKKKNFSVGQSFLESALMQNFYEGQYIKERKLYTAKIQQHYSKDHQQRPRSINSSYRKQFYTQRNWNQKIKDFAESVPAIDHKLFVNSKLAKKLQPQQFENLRIKRYFLRKDKDIIIPRIKQPSQNKSMKGLIPCQS